MLRRREAVASNQQVGVKTMWESLVGKRLLHDEHRYEEMDWEHEVVPKGAARILPKSCFQPSVKDMSCDRMKDVMGFNAKTSWPSCNADTSCGDFLDLKVAQHFAATNTWGHVGMTWFSCLCYTTEIAIRKRSQGSPWLLPISISGGFVVCWPACQQQGGAGDQLFYTPSTDATAEDVVFICITDLEDWEAVHVRWVTLLVQFKDFGQVLVPGAGASFRGEVRSLGQLAARNAYWSLSKTMLERLCRYYGVVFERGASLLEVLRALVTGVTKLPENDVINILELRAQAHRVDHAMQGLIQKEAFDLCDKADQEEFTNSGKDFEVQQSVTQEYHTGLRKLRQELRAKSKRKNPLAGKKYRTWAPAGVPDATLCVCVGADLLAPHSELVGRCA